MGVDLFVEILGFDEGVLATVGVDCLLDMVGVVGEALPDGFGITDEETLTTITLFSEASKAHLTREEGIAGPDGPGEDAGGVGGGCHGDKFSVVMTGEDILSFVDDEEQRGGIAKDA